MTQFRSVLYIRHKEELYLILKLSQKSDRGTDVKKTYQRGYYRSSDYIHGTWSHRCVQNECTGSYHFPCTSPISLSAN